jgi:hypothetical protein
MQVLRGAVEEGRKLDCLDNVMKTISTLLRHNFQALASAAAPTADRLNAGLASGSLTLQAHGVADDFLRRVFECIALELSAEIAAVCAFVESCS